MAIRGECYVLRAGGGGRIQQLCSMLRVQVKTLLAVWGLIALPALPLSNYTALGSASLFASSCLDCQY